MPIKNCDCVGPAAEWQEKRYGLGKRVHNQCKLPGDKVKE